MPIFVEKMTEKCTNDARKMNECSPGFIHYEFSVNAQNSLFLLGFSYIIIYIILCIFILFLMNMNE